MKANWAIHDRLLRLFDGDSYEEFHTPKYVFVKQWNGNKDRWQVAIYPAKSWVARERYKQAVRVNDELDSRLNFLIDKP